MRSLIKYALVAMLAGCATTPPPMQRLNLRLAPSDLGQAISVQQHLVVERGGRIDELDAALEADATHLTLVGLAFGQRVLSIDYDGQHITEWRHVMLPKQVRAEDVLQDLQLTLWPLAQLQAALPPGWRVEDDGLLRTLSLDGAVIATLRYSAMPRWSGTVVLDNLRYRYRLTIQTAP